ncbi:MAG: ATP-dependent DNA helicase [Candidatus Pristimantibacillus sp.]
MTHTINIAVRPLVEYVFRRGSIESGFRTIDAMTEGTKAHQKIQKQYGDQDEKEVYLSAEVVCNEIVFVIDGRCDGLLKAENGLVTVDEIKSTSISLDLIEGDGWSVHWAQAICYAYMYARAHGLERMGIQLTYVQVESEERRIFWREMSFEELEADIASILAQYAPYAELLLQNEQERDASIAQLVFPFDGYREGQRKLAGAVYRTIEAGANLFAKAPTGIGKTISTTFPAVKAFGSGLLTRLFYLTARTTTRVAAEEAFSRMGDHGLRMHVVTITAKASICFQEEVRCDKWICEYADGYYDRLNGALLDMLGNETLMTRGVIEQYARKHRICPFEFSLDAAYAADAILCDYNYIYDPRVSLKRLLGEQKKQTALLIDEAHNLVDRAREMFSGELEKAAFLALQRELKANYPAGYKAAKAVNDYFIALRKESGERLEWTMAERPEGLFQLLEVFSATAELRLAGGESGLSVETEALLLDVYFAAQAFLRAAKLYDERYTTYVEALRSGNVRIKLFCLDPSHLLRQIGKGYRSRIYFSATLSPVSYYMDMLGAEPEDYTLTVPSPFHKEQLEVIIEPISTRYHDRERSMGPITALLKQLVNTRPGNYLIFFPSYAYMNDSYEHFVADEGENGAEQGMMAFDTLIQQTVMSEEARGQFMAAFRADNERTLLGFAVMGGIFSEGIDLVGDRLTGVVVVGVGLPQVGAERNILKAYYDAAGKNGFNYAYVYPGMNKVLQAGGRLIRSESDRGTLVLVDDRYLQPQYERLLPDEWLHYTVDRAGKSIDRL